MMFNMVYNQISHIYVLVFKSLNFNKDSILIPYILMRQIVNQIYHLMMLNNQIQLNFQMMNILVFG